MEIDVGIFVCLWCGVTFPRRRLTGRKPCYCHRTCRQRAHEVRRRGAVVASHPQAAPAAARHPGPRRYEAGRRRALSHALRPAVPPDRQGRRNTLCGTWASPIRQRFGPLDVGRRNCPTCDGVTRRHPPPRAIDPSLDLAVLTNLARRLQAELLTTTPTTVTAAAIVAFCWPDAA